MKSSVAEHTYEQHDCCVCHCNESADDVLACDTIRTLMWVPTFWRNRMSPISGSPEEGDTMFLCNTGFYLQVHIMSQPRTTIAISEQDKFGAQIEN